MNLVEAIRQAAIQAMNKPADERKPFETASVDTDWTPEPFQAWAAAQEPDPPEAPESETPPVPAIGSVEFAEAPAAPESGGLVRVEVFLPQDQLAGFFRAVASTQHPILTMREASALLRVSSTKLQALADSGQVPAFRVDGKWRFSKSGLEAWIEGQQEADDAA